MPDRSRPLRILHIVGRMNRGGVETWLMNLLRTVSRDSWQMDFLVGDPTPADYDEEIRQRGARIFPCPLQNPFLYIFRLIGILRKFGPYDAIHSHADLTLVQKLCHGCATHRLVQVSVIKHNEGCVPTQLKRHTFHVGATDGQSPNVLAYRGRSGEREE